MVALFSAGAAPFVGSASRHDIRFVTQDRVDCRATARPVRTRVRVQLPMIGTRRQPVASPVPWPGRRGPESDLHRRANCSGCGNADEQKVGTSNGSDGIGMRMVGTQRGMAVAAPSRAIRSPYFLRNRSAMSQRKHRQIQPDWLDRGGLFKVNGWVDRIKKIDMRPAMSSQENGVSAAGNRRQINPFYVLLGLFGIALVVTGVAYGLMMYQTLQPAGAAAEKVAHPLYRLMNEYGNRPPLGGARTSCHIHRRGNKNRQLLDWPEPTGRIVRSHRKGNRT